MTKQTTPQDQLQEAIHHHDVMAINDLLAIESVINTINLPDEDGFTPLLRATQLNHHDIMKQLITAGASPDASSGNARITITGVGRGRQVAPIHLAVTFGRHAVALLIDKGANPSLVMQHGWTVAHVAARFGAFDVHSVLADNGVDIDVPDDDDETPLHRAIMAGYPTCAEVLIKAGASLADRHGRKRRTALELAKKKGRTGVVRYIQSMA